MAGEFFLVGQDLPGQLWIMPRPDGDHLSENMAAYRAAGINRIVSMLAEDETEVLGLGQEAASCAAHQITFENHPIADFGLPERGAFATLVGRIVHWLGQGESVAVHCRGGIGRSGMVNAAVLIALGETAPAAVQRVIDARGVTIPDTAEQAKFIEAFAENAAKH